jgi:Ca2+:H+ antiporter
VTAFLNLLSSRQRLFVVLTFVVTAVAGGAFYGGSPDVMTFLLAAAALCGMAWLVSFSTEVLGEHLSAGATGVVQSTLGNLPELFVVIFALKAGEVEVAQLSILGSLFANALLVLGAAMFMGALKSPDGVMRFSKRLPNDTATLLLVAVFIIVILGLSATTGDKASHHQTTISAVGAVLLLIVYAIWLRDYLRGGGAEHDPRATEHTHHAETVPLAPVIGMLAVAGVGAAFVSDWFVGALDGAIESLHISRAFAGLVIVAIAGNAVENVAAVTLAAKGKNDLSVSVVKNSVAQIAAFLFPLLILISLFFATPLTFVIAPVYIGALLLTALAIWQITGDGEATKMEGAALMALYVALAFLTFYE